MNVMRRPLCEMDLEPGDLVVFHGQLQDGLKWENTPFILAMIQNLRYGAVYTFMGPTGRKECFYETHGLRTEILSRVAEALG